MQKKIALIGSGNSFFKDEGIGLYAAKYLKENYIFSPDIEIVDGGILGFKLMPLLQEFEKVIIVNIASDDRKKIGEIFTKTSDEFLEGGSIKKSANEVELVEMLQACSLTEMMAETTVISIVPEDIISVEVALSKNLQKAWDNYIETILLKLDSIGVKRAKKKRSLNLESILDIFANPSVEFSRGF